MQCSVDTKPYSFFSFFDIILWIVAAVFENVKATNPNLIKEIYGGEAGDFIICNDYGKKWSELN